MTDKKIKFQQDERAIDAQAVQGVLSGDTAQFRAIVSRYKNLVYSLLYRQLGDIDISEELSQEVFLKAYKGLSTFRGDSSFKSWLVQITLNTSRTYYSSRRFRDLKRTDSYEYSEEKGRLDQDSLQKKEFLTHFRNCFTKLKQPLQEIITLCGVNEYSYEEAAGDLSIPIGTVRSRLNRARLLLASCLEKKGAFE